MSTPTREPSLAYSGDSITWTKTVADYPPSGGWTLKYSFRSKDRLELTATATTSGDGYAVTITPAQSALFPIGWMAWTSFVVNVGATERHAVGSGQIQIFNNPETGEGVQPLSTARQALSAVDAALIENAARPEGSVTFPDGRTVSYRNHAELQSLRNSLLSEVRAEEVKARVASGKKSGSNIAITFVNT